jgi:PAS domain-containing protein
MNSPLPRRQDVVTEQRLQLLIETVTDYGIFMLDPEGRIISWNTGAQKLKGWQREEILGHHFSIFYPAEAVASGWPQEELRRAKARGRFEDEGGACARTAPGSGPTWSSRRSTTRAASSPASPRSPAT